MQAAAALRPVLPCPLHREDEMQMERFNEMKLSAVEQLAKDTSCLREHAEQVVMEKTQDLIDKGQAYELSDDEERMLIAYRKFIATSKPGAIFSWESTSEVVIVLPPAAALLLDPRDVSARPSLGE